MKTEKEIRQKLMDIGNRLGETLDKSTYGDVEALLGRISALKWVLEDSEEK